MATKLYLRNTEPDTHLGTNNANLRGTASSWSKESLSTSKGGGAANGGSNTVAGPTAGVEVYGNSEFISPPVSADVTISGTITANIWASETNMSANVAINVVIEIIRANATGTANSNTLVEIVRSTRTTEVAVTTRAVNNFTTGMTSGAYTSQTLNRGDRLRIRVFGDDSTANMASGFIFDISVDGATDGADGDTWVQFSEDFSFEGAPSGSQIFLTDTASDVSTSSVDREAWTSRGGGVVSDVTNTAAGWTAPIQVTDTAGGTAVDWFTKPLQAFTLGGMAVANLRALTSAADAGTSLRCQIARVDGDGTNATVWADWCIQPQSPASTTGLLTTTEDAFTANVSGADLAVSDGQRLRIRVYLDDANQMATGRTVTFFYNGTSAAASGDSYVTFPQTLAEFSSTPKSLVWQPAPSSLYCR